MIVQRLNHYEIPRECRSKLQRKQQCLAENRREMREKLAQTSLDKKLIEEICALSATELATRIRSGTLQADLVLAVFQHQCIEHLDRNFLSDFLYKSSDQVASLARVEQRQSPLFGVPVSLKECISVQGHDTTRGLVKFALSPQTADSVVFRVLTEVAHAVPFITTSMAQAGLSLDSSNPLFGVQVNAHFPEYLSGGSSGGEALALALRASPLGVGTDIGGSIRFPAAFNGICGLKPTLTRLSTKGLPKVDLIPCLSLRPALGPMARTVQDLVSFMRAVLCPLHFQLDSQVIPLAFDEQTFSSGKNLRIGFYTNLSPDESKIVAVVPAVTRAIEESVQRLRSLGHELVPFQVPRPEYAFSLYLRALFNDGGKNLLGLTANEPKEHSLKESLRILALPRVLKKTLKSLAVLRYGPQAEICVSSVLGETSSSGAAITLNEIRIYRQEFLDAMSAQSLDAIICPVFPNTVPKRDYRDIVNNACIPYAALYNLVNLPAGVVPVTCTTEQDNCKAREASKRFPGPDKINAFLHRDQTTCGLPIACQVIAKPFREELVLRLMKQLEADC